MVWQSFLLKLVLLLVLVLMLVLMMRIDAGVEAQRVWVRCDGVAVVVVDIGGVVVKVGVDEDRR